MVVDLPAPLGPRKPTISPFLRSKDILSTAFWVPYILVSDETLIDMGAKILILQCGSVKMNKKSPPVLAGRL
jgi:hypothetical protein